MAQDFSAAADTPLYGLQRAPLPAGGPVHLPAGSRFAAALLRWLGWQSHFSPLPGTHGLLVVYPHTSNWDFPLGLLYKWSNGMPFRFWIKDSAMRLPLMGAWIRKVGGVSINRKAAHGVVETTIKEMRSSPFFWLVVAPEGTRSYSNGWRTGFYHLWQASGCPLIITALPRLARPRSECCESNSRCAFCGPKSWFANEGWSKCKVISVVIIYLVTVHNQSNMRGTYP